MTGRKIHGIQEVQEMITAVSAVMTEGVVMTEEAVMTEVDKTAPMEIGIAQSVRTPTSHSEPNATAVMPQSQAAEMVAAVMNAVVVVMTEEAVMTEVDKTAPMEIGIAPSVKTPTSHSEPNAIAAMLQKEAVAIEEIHAGAIEEALAVSAVVNAVALIKSAMTEEVETTVENAKTITEAIMTGLVHNAVIPTSHSEPNATAVMHPRMEAAAQEAATEVAQEEATEVAQEAVTEAAQEEATEVAQAIQEAVTEVAQEEANAAIEETQEVANAAIEETQEVANAAIEETQEVANAAIEETQEVANAAIVETQGAAIKADKEVRVERDGKDLLSVAHQAEFSDHGHLRIHLDTITIEKIQVIPLIVMIEEGKFHA
jgi:hypothetical protein